MTNSNNASGGIGLAGLLTVLFVGLKLANIIHWSWWWVLSPIPIGMVTTFLVVFILAVAVEMRKR